MAIQPCGCGMHELDWPYDLVDFDPEDTNGLHCGEDPSGDTALWTYPGPEHGGFYARKGTASGIASGEFVVVPGPYTEHFGETLFASGVFTAPRAGLYDVLWKFEPSDDAVDEAFDTWGRVSSNYAAWSSPYLKQIAPSRTFLGGGCVVSGYLPCLEGGTLTYEVFHNHTGATSEMKNVVASALWKCPIPT